MHSQRRFGSKVLPVNILLFKIGSLIRPLKNDTFPMFSPNQFSGYGVPKLVCPNMLITVVLLLYSSLSSNVQIPSSIAPLSSPTVTSIPISLLHTQGYTTQAATSFTNNIRESFPRCTTEHNPIHSTSRDNRIVAPFVLFTPPTIIQSDYYRSVRPQPNR